MTILIPSRSDSSLKSLIPSTFLSFTRSAIFIIRLLLFTIYGISVTIILSLPDFVVSSVNFDLTVILPLPVEKASLIPFLPKIIPPVGKSGPVIWVISSLSSISGLSITAAIALQTSVRLCGAIFVAIPTAIPLAPLRRRLGSAVGRTRGSFMESS